MAGNVAEWCYDWFDKDKARERVVCGGSYQDMDERLFQVTARRGRPPGSHERWIGFRGVVRIAIPQEQ
jgi:formylglycine-generating enzyme required for sulfatase activity